MHFKIKSKNYFYFATLCIWIVTVFTKLKYNGLIFGFNFGLYHPDGALYTTTALQLSGYTEFESASIVYEWYSLYAYKFFYTSPLELYASNNDLYTAYSSRILYPLLSVPFIKLFGVAGMLAIPALSLLIIMLIITKIGIKLNKTLESFLILFMVASSAVVMRWMMINTTDSLFVGLFGIVAYALFIVVPNPRWYFIFGTLIVLTSLTRFSLLFWFAIALVLFMQTKVKKAIFVFILSSLMSFPALLNNSTSSFLPVESQRNFLDRFLIYPFYVFKIIFYEIVQLFVLDRILFFMLFLSILYSIKYFYKESSKYFISYLTAGLLTGALNGTVGVNFRYQLPILIFMCWSLIDNINFTTKGFLKKSD